jgi:hypothetical protein
MDFRGAHPYIFLGYTMPSKGAQCNMPGIKVPRAFHTRIQDALVLLHQVIKQYPIGSTVDQTDIRAKLELVKHNIDSALIALFRRQPRR